ncbi:MAG: hypothetical protein KDA65_09765 [Planctomycetaceae bacterium]|nr:hypothetical protein [Planctomycetaceae bacterium]
MSSYVACLLWCFRAFGNLRTFNPRFPRLAAALATFVLALPYVTLIAGFWLLSLLYRRSSMDESVRSRTAWLPPGYVLVRCGLVNMIWWGILILPFNEEFSRSLLRVFRGWTDLVLLSYLLVLVVISAWAAISFILKIGRMQQDLAQLQSIMSHRECSKCGELIPGESTICPVCGFNLNPEESGGMV